MRLPRFFHQHLRSCGVGVMWLILNSCFLTLPAVAEIVYTPVNVAISGNGRINIDLNHDGIADFTIAANDGYSPCGAGRRFYGMATLFPATGNGVVVPVLGSPVVPLASGTLVSASDTFQTQAVVESFAFAFVISVMPTRICPAYSQGWCPVTFTTMSCSLTAYMGLAFKINGQIHYGWAYLSVKVGRNGVFNTTLKGFAYETVAGRAITTGSTSGN